MSTQVGASDAAAARWQQVSALLDTALELSDAEREAWLAGLRIADPEVRRELEVLLASCGRVEGFLERPASDYAAELLDADADPASHALSPGARVGPFRVLHLIGHGGMGAVYLAERDDAQFRQQVALKLVRDGVGSAYLLRRFVDERQILASLEHPGIARVVDGGVTEARAPWFAMEYVDGLPVDRYCADRALSVEQRVELVCQVCDAVEHAHRRLVVHRDLKPGNILVTAEGRVKLLDFGIAKLLDPEGAVGGADTRPGLRALTPEYASPEQLRGEPATTACDVYALGVLLYLLLAGRHPLSALHGSADGRLRLLTGVLPAAPSAAVAQAPAAQPSDAAERARLRRRLRGDLDAIVLRAMRPEPDERYASAGDLAAELRRYLRGLPVRARADVRGYVVRKFVQRHRWGVVAGTAALLALLAAGAVTAVQARRIAAQAANLATERDKARQTATLLVELFSVSDPSVARGQTVTAREILDRGTARVARDLRDQPAVLAQMQDAIGRAYFGLGLYAEARPLLEAALGARRRLYGGRHLEVAQSLYQQAYLLRHQGDFAAAESLYREALAIRRALLPPGDSALVEAMNGLAFVLRGRGDFAEAGTLYREALAAGRGRLGGGHPEVLVSVTGLAAVLRGQGDLVAAEPLTREAYLASRAQRGPADPATAIALYNLAVLLHEMDRPDEADPLFREVIAIDRRILGDRHPLLAVDLVGHARLLLDRGDRGEAERLLGEALAIQRAALPAGHERIATTLIALGQVLTESGRARAAEPMLRRALAGRVRALKPDHWLIAEARSALGASLSALGRLDEAEPLLRDGHRALAASRPATDPRVRRASRELERHRERRGERRGERGPAAVGAAR